MLKALPHPAEIVLCDLFARIDALSEFGVKHIEMPATPDRVWRAIHQR